MFIVRALIESIVGYRLMLRVDLKKARPIRGKTPLVRSRAASMTRSPVGVAQPDWVFSPFPPPILVALPTRGDPP